MITVKNTLNQPLPVNITNEESIHFLAKEAKEVTEDQIKSPEFKNLIDKGALIVLKMELE